MTAHLVMQAGHWLVLHWHAVAPHLLHCPPGELPDAHVGCIAT